jgi:hypothetical protein
MPLPCSARRTLSLSWVIPRFFFENRMASEQNTRPHRGFDRKELANHFFEGHSHHDGFMEAEHSNLKSNFYPMVAARGQNTQGAGDTRTIFLIPPSLGPACI